MAQVVYADNALANLERAFEFLADHDPTISLAAATAIREAVDMLATHPLVGRRIEGDLRELVISYGQTGYVALYRFLPAQDVVRVLALRHQRELDYPL
ncbi:MAG: type II toxin-antitoxin system RelE/ParE family toxin [Gammaproteobacteria bacterium]